MRCAAQSAEISLQLIPHTFFGVAPEENVEETFAELIADPFLKVSGMAHRKHPA